MKHEPMCPRSSMQCLVYHEGSQCPGFGECTCEAKARILATQSKIAEEHIKNINEYLSPCPLTNSSHEKALVRVVEKYAGSTIECDMHKEYIQSICICGYIVNENELKYE